MIRHVREEDGWGVVFSFLLTNFMRLYYIPKYYNISIMKALTLLSIIAVFLLLIALTQQQCTHPIFCSQPILKAIASSSIFPDSKSFVDLVLKVPVETALTYFLSKNTTQFVNLSFHLDPNIILQPTSFDDYQETPAFINKIRDSNLKDFGKELHKRWNLLGKKVTLSNAKTIGSCVSKCTSYIEQVDNKKILVPGGRFRESYYWDTYWIILGLITSDMLDTAESILDTFALIIQKYGFIPNGLRQYYLNRSQPPLFFLMIKRLTEAHMKKGQSSRAAQIQKKYFQVLLSEHNYWQQTHSVTIEINGASFKVNQYRAKTQAARPQSFRQDTATVSSIINPQERARVLSCISSMAESGWDFSSRWLDDPNALQTTIIDKIIPTDLNAFLGLQESYLASLSTKMGRGDLVPYFIKRLEERRKYFSEIKKDARYPDFHVDMKEWVPRSVYPTDYLAAMLFSDSPSLKSIYKDLVNPASSKINTGQQWDSPNVWAPNNWILHEVAPFDEAAAYAKQWIKTTYCSWKKTGNLYEKYRNDAFGERGQGGEYVVQTGFGWTNGLALYYLSLYGDTYTVGSCE